MEKVLSQNFPGIKGSEAAGDAPTGGLGARVSLSLALATFSQAMKRRKEVVRAAFRGFKVLASSFCEGAAFSRGLQCLAAGEIIVDIFHHCSEVFKILHLGGSKKRL